MYDTREENSMTIRSIAAWIIALTMVLSFVSFACAEEYEFAWGTSQSSVIEKMGEPDETDEDEGRTVLRYQDKTFGKYNHVLVVQVFKNDGLICWGFAFQEDADLNTYHGIANTFEEKYGKSTDSLQTLYEYLVVTGEYNQDEVSFDAFKNMADSMQDKFQYMTWKPDSQTCICLYVTMEEDQNETFIVYYQPDDKVSE